jgi:hypothetical protein
MLSIIPKEVLASLGNIHKILDIGNTIKRRNNNSNMKESAPIEHPPAAV